MRVLHIRSEEEGTFDWGGQLQKFLMKTDGVRDYRKNQNSDFRDTERMGSGGCSLEKRNWLPVTTKKGGRLWGNTSERGGV